MIRALAIAFAVLAPGAAGACPIPMPLPVPQEVTAPLAEWIAAHSAYPPPEGAPVILLCRIGETITYEGHPMLVDPDLRAAYDLVNDRIFLVAPWSPDDPMALSTLLHEMVHRAQFAARDWPCPQAAEPEAYRLQEAWLAEQGIDAGFDWFGIYMRARCPPDHHP